MNNYGIQQKNTFASSCEEMRNAISVSVSFDKGERMVCPKPRRFSVFNAPISEPVRPLRWHMCYQPEPYESKAGLDLLEIIFEKDGVYGASEKTCAKLASSPPFFSGSPPSRVSNPLVQDTRFRDDKVSPVSGRSVIPIPASGMPALPPSSETKIGPVSGNFGNKPTIRVEGFDCRFARDNRSNCSIPALA